MPVAIVNGHRQNVSAAFGAERLCAQCGSLFHVTSTTGRQLYCSEKCKDRAYYERHRDTVKHKLRNRARCEAWYDGRRKYDQPWLYGPPLCDRYLPGGGFEIAVRPVPQWPVERRNIRALHGMVTALLDQPHDKLLPQFSLVPWPRGIGWGVWVRDVEVARQIAGRTVSARLFDRDVDVTCSPLHRVLAPVVTKRGRRRLRIDTITPVCIRSMGSSVWRTQPTAGNLCSSLAWFLPKRVGVEIKQDSVRLELVEQRTTTERVRLGGKFGAVHGFMGHLVVETNAVGHWLLKAAETVGFGGRVAFGFGRVRVSDALV